MKNKKSFILLLFLSIILVLTGCGKSNKQALINEYDQMASRKKIKANFDMKITKLELPKKDKSDIDSQTETYLKFLKEGSITGEAYSDGKNAKYNLKFNAMGQSIPLEFVGNNDRLYLKADVIESVVTLMSRIPMGKNPNLDGKYIDVIDVMRESGSIDDKKAKQTESVTESATNIQKDSSSALKNTINSLPNDAITKKDDEITTTIHKKEFIKFVESLKKQIDQDKSIKENPISNDDIKKIDSEFKTLDVVIKLNSKKSTFDYTISCEPKDGGKAEIQLNMKSEDYDGKVKLPSKDKIMDTEELVKLYDAISGDK